MAIHESLAEGIGSLVRKSGILAESPDVEVYTWTWKAADREGMSWSEAFQALVRSRNPS